MVSQTEKMLHRDVEMQAAEERRSYLRPREHSRREKVTTIVLVYVDDMSFVSGTEKMLRHSTEEFLQILKFTDEGSPDWYLGLHIICRIPSLMLLQSAYVRHALQEYDLEDVKEVAAPMAGNFSEELDAHAEEPILEEERRWHSVTIILRPKQFFVKSVKRIFGCLKGTSDFGLVYNAPSTEEIHLHFYADSDFAADKTTRKSSLRC